MNPTFPDCPSPLSILLTLSHTQEVAFLAFLHFLPENRSRLRDPVMHHDIIVEKGRLLKTRMWDEGCGKHKACGRDLNDGIWA